MTRALPLVAASALVLAFAGQAWALPVDWRGSWSVDGSAETRLVRETLPGQLTVEASVPLEGSDSTVELNGAATAGGLALDSQWVEGIGIVGVLDNVHTKKKHDVALRATARQDGASITIDALFTVDGALVRHETWRSTATLELVDLEAQGQPLAGDYDPKIAGPLTIKLRVNHGSLAVRARVVVDSGHPYASFYTSPVIFESSLGALEPGDHTLVWDGRDTTAAARLALAGPYRVVLEPASPAAATAPVASVGEEGLPLPAAAPASTRSGAPLRAPSAPAADAPGSVSSCFTVAAPRLELLCSDWPANYGFVTRPRWSEGAALGQSARFLETAPAGKPGLAFEAPRVLKDARTAAGYFEKSAFAVVETHGNPDGVFFYSGDPTVPWKAGDPEDGITGRFFGAGDLADLHFAFAIICDGAIPDAQGYTFVRCLRDAGCDVAIGFEATISVAEGAQFRDVVFQLLSQGSPIEKAARDAARTTFAATHPQPEKFLLWTVGTRSPTDSEMDALIDKERATPADPDVDYGIKSLASSIVVERGAGIPADESLWPPRYGNSKN